MTQQNPSAPAGVPINAAEPSDLDVAQAAEQDAARRSVDAQFPAVAAFLAAERGERR